ncbi:MAG TPA: hypothetical protein VFC63_07490 [Blastocatellia bacterium]|nr:hypothetical protein [Blastocatellia bacterium]
MSYATTPIAPPPRPKRRTALTLIINVIRGLLAIVFLIAVLPLGSHLWTWMHCGNAPAQMTLEDYLKNGSDNDWVVLTGVYVDGHNSIETQWVERGQSTGQKGTTYFPLLTGPNDTRPVKVFLDPTNYVVTEPQPLLLEGPGFPGNPDKGHGYDDRQTVRGLRLRWFDVSSDLEKVLKSCKLGTTDQIVVIRQGRQPVSSSEAYVMIAVLSGIPILFGLTFIRFRKSAK